MHSSKRRWISKSSHCILCHAFGKRRPEVPPLSSGFYSKNSMFIQEIACRQQHCSFSHLMDDVCIVCVSVSIFKVPYGAILNWMCNSARHALCLNVVRNFPLNSTDDGVRFHLPAIKILCNSAPEEVWPAWWGSGLFHTALLSWGPFWSNMSRHGAPNTRRMWSCWVCRRAMKRFRGLEHLTCEEFLKESGLFSQDNDIKVTVGHHWKYHLMFRMVKNTNKILEIARKSNILVL